MDISEDCWEHVGLLQEVSAAEPPPPPPAPDFLIQQQEVSCPFLFLLRFFGFAIERSSIDTIREKKAREIGCVIVFLQSVDLNVRFILLFYFIVNTLVIYVIFFIIRGKVYMVIKIILQGDMV